MTNNELYNFLNDLGIEDFLTNTNDMVDNPEDKATPIRDFKMQLIKNGLYLDILINCLDKPVALAAKEEMAYLYKDFMMHNATFPTSIPTLFPTQPMYNPFVDMFNVHPKDVTYNGEAGKGTGNNPIGG